MDCVEYLNRQVEELKTKVDELEKEIQSLRLQLANTNPVTNPQPYPVPNPWYCPPTGIPWCSIGGGMTYIDDSSSRTYWSEIG